MSKIAETTPLKIIDPPPVETAGPVESVALLAAADRRIAELEARIARIETVAANSAAQVGCLEVGMNRRDRLSPGLPGLRFLGGTSIAAFEEYVKQLLDYMRTGGGGGRGDGST